jgi:tripartite-type tricarboxylate transporter receptor subunit TctC
VAVNTPEITQYIERVGSIKSPRITPAELADDIGKELVQQQAIIKKLGMVNN